MLSCTLLGSAQGGKDQAALELLATARQIVDIRMAGSPPFHLVQHLRLMGPAHQWVEGDYVVTWAAPEQWRDELTLSEFHETRIATQGNVWSIRTQKFATALAAEVRSFANWFAPLKIIPKSEHLGRIQNQKDGENALRCLSVLGGWGSVRVLCFDSGREYLLHASTRLNGSGSETELDNYIPFGQKMIPQAYHLQYNGQSILETYVKEAEILSRVEPGEFAAPTDANAVLTCEAPSEPIPVRKPDPSYTRGALAHKIQGNIVLDVGISEQGGVENVSIVKYLDPDLDEAAAEIIKKKWLFKPAECGGNPVPFSTLVEVSFRRL